MPYLCLIMSTVTFTRSLPSALARRLKGRQAVIVTDTNVDPLLTEDLRQWPRTVIPAGEEHKNLDTLADVWRRWADMGVTRRWMAVCIGGGVVTDLGGLAAAMYMRGIPTINVPTTTLGAVDASIGGKTAVDLDGIKNLVGAFHAPEHVLVDTALLKSQPADVALSGYGEMLKHAVIDGYAPTLMNEANLRGPSAVATAERWLRLSQATKLRLAEADPADRGVRRYLNLGHTTAHAIEALRLRAGRAAVPHGHAVAWGLVVAGVLDALERPGADHVMLQLLSRHVRDHFGPWPLACSDLPRLVGLMAHDKKNAAASRPAFVVCRLSLPSADIDGRVDSHPHILTPDADILNRALDIAHDLLDQ